MVYQPKVTKTNSYIGGVAKLRNQNGKVAVLYSTRKYPDGTPVNGDHAGKSYLCSEWPEYLTPEKVDGQIVYAKLSGDGKKLYQVSPQDGIVELLFTGFGSKEDQEPVPSAPKQDNWGNDYTTATAIFEITDGEPWMIGLPQFLTIRPSLFMPDDEGNVTIKGLGNGKAVHGPRLNEFLTHFGGWDRGAMKYTDNPLPEFQKRMLAVRKKCKVGIQNGFIANFWDTVETDEFPEEFVEDTTEVYSEEPVVTETDSLWEDDEEEF